MERVEHYARANAEGDSPLEPERAEDTESCMGKRNS